MNTSAAVVILALGLAHEASAYNRTAAHQYIVDWCDTDLNKNGNVDHVNNPFAFESPGVGDFVWWYKFKPLAIIPIEPFNEKGITLSDYGWDWIPKRWGFNCTNFVSQVLKGGGIAFTGLNSQWDDAAHGTFKRVDRLHNALLYSANAVAVTIASPRDNPSSLAVGDPVRFPTISHMAVIESTNPIVLAYNSSDFCAPRYMPLAKLEPRYFPLIGFHIIGDTIAARPDVTPPAMHLLRADGTTIPDGGFTGTTVVTAILTDGGDGVERLEVFNGAPLIDGMYNFSYGFATEMFRDEGIAGGSSTSTISIYTLKEGATAYFQGFDTAGNVTIQGVTMDQTRPALGLLDANGTTMLPSPSGVSATSMTQVSVRGTDSNAGIGRITILKPDNTTSTQTFSGELVAYATFSALAAGAYVAKVYDRAENYTSGEFSIITTQQVEGSWANATAPGVGLGSLANSTNAPSGYCPDNTGAGICSATWSGPNYSRTWSFDAASGARVGIATGLAQGTYTLTCVNCAQSSSAKSLFYSTSSIPNFAMFGVTPTGNQFNESRSVSTDEIGDVATTRLRIKVACVPGGYCSGPTTGTACAMMKLYVEGGQAVDCFSHLGGEIYGETLLMPQSASFAVKNETQTASDFNVTIEASIYKFAAYDRAVSTTLAVGQMTSGGVLLATVSVQEVLPTFSSSNTAASIESTLRTASVQSWDCGSTAALAARQGLSPAAGCTGISGSELVFLRPATMTVTVQGSTAPPVLDSASVKIYGWTGSSWTLSGIPSQGKTVSTSSVILATGSFTRSGQYGILFSIADASAPLTSWSIQGSSSSFAGITFVSTYSYLVLSATDPVVDGFHSGLAITYYRIDGLPGDAYSVYSTSLSFLPGTHWVDYYAVDWAGNVEGIKRTTITVTAGSVTKLSGDLQVDGNLLVGFLGSGAKAEVVARAEYDYALMVSSVDGRVMLAVDNANFASIGTAPASGRLTLAGVAGDTALALRSGNSTAAVTGAQLAFGYDGTGELRHRLYTQHGSAANLNKLVFALWTPATGSSTTLGGLPLLSLEGSTITPANALVQVMPGGVSDVADKELVVSSGGVMGGGDVLRWDRWVPSAAHLKKDIRRLGRAEEEKAWADIAALKPVEYRRKAWGPDAPLERGYVFEETPQSIRDGPGATSLDERLVNAELALKAAMRRIVELKARIKKAKEARR